VSGKDDDDGGDSVAGFTLWAKDIAARLISKTKVKILGIGDFGDSFVGGPLCLVPLSWAP
jgi:hypothetical protein